MNIDVQRAKQIVSSARSQSFDGVVIPKSASQKDKDDALNRFNNSVKAKTRKREVVLVAVEID